MSITLTANYQQVLNVVTVEKIDELLEENHDLQCMLTFIDEHNESDFVAHYEEYVRCGEAIGYEAVDALIEELGNVCYVEDCDERYQGFYDDEADFAEHWVTNVLCEHFPDFVVIDWEATWEKNLRYDYTACNDGSTFKPCHIFRDN
jgi:antirestriction protein